jgi:hypothetical protein
VAAFVVESMKKRAFLLMVPNILVLGAYSFELGLRCDDLLAYPAYLVAGLLGLVMALMGIIYGIYSGRRGALLALLCAATIAAFALVPVIRDWRRSLEFSLKRPGYLEVVDLVRQGNIEADSTQLANVDAAHEYLLPCGKQIAVEKGDGGLAVIFFISNGIFGEFKGYMYVENDRPPTTGQFRELRQLNPDHWAQIRRVDAHWYYVAYDH